MIRKWWVKKSVFDDVEEEESDGWLIIGEEIENLKVVIDRVCQCGAEVLMDIGEELMMWLMNYCLYYIKWNQKFYIIYCSYCCSYYIK